MLAKKRERYARASKEHKIKIINELVELFDYHRKAAIRALQALDAGGGAAVVLAGDFNGKARDGDGAFGQTGRGFCAKKQADNENQE